MFSQLYIGIANHGRALPKADMVEYVTSVLSEEMSFKQIVETLQISDPKELKWTMFKALGYKF